MDEMVFGKRYRLTEKIGSGGMADVYKAVDDVLGRTVAGKVVNDFMSGLNTPMPHPLFWKIPQVPQ